MDWSVHQNRAAISAANTLERITGLGSMGLAMAVNLQKHLTSQGVPGLRYHNRTMSRGAPLADAGGVPASSIGGLVNQCDIIFMSLSDDSAQAFVVAQILKFCIQTGHDLCDKIIVDTSTVHPDSSRAAEAELGAQGGLFVAAPVFGASPVAAQGQLLWILAGNGDAIRAIKPFIVGVMGRGIIELGEDVRQSSLMKTAG
jgi:3-hydroxyisobutyrate dehydrogenase-like beta-hydroxyacid dehydrogenase